MIRTLFIIFITIYTTTSFAQSKGKNTYNALLINVNYGFQIPSADLATRFGNNFSIGGGIDYLSERDNWIIGLAGSNIFGRNVKEDVLASLRDKDGFIIGNSDAGAGSYALVVLRERGFYLGGHIGKLFSLSKKNPRSGIRATIGLGLLQHKIRIQDESGTAKAIANEYIKGYDQLSNGLALKQFIGYQHLNINRGFNFFAGLEFTEGFTQSRRSFNFVTQSIDTTKRLDVLIGFRIGWTISFYIGEKGEDLIY